MCVICLPGRDIHIARCRQSGYQCHMTNKPFLKWVGGKRQLLADIAPLIPDQFTRYIEPFVGGGAVFFHLSTQLTDKTTPSLINDINPELVNCYQMVKTQTDELIELLKTHHHDKDYYLEIRNLDRQEGGLAKLSPLERASRFLYLNRTGFNGMYRVNSKGLNNVPFGRYKNPSLVNEDVLRAAAHALRFTAIQNKSFEACLEQAEMGDFVYLDPPYVPLNETSYFTSYMTDGFNMADQTRLAELVRELDQRGVVFIASNACMPVVQELYSGFRQIEVKAKRAINANGKKRQPISELLITNAGAA